MANDREPLDGLNPFADAPDRPSRREAEFTLVTTTVDGSTTGRRLNALDLDGAINETWGQIERLDDIGEQVAFARIEWEDPTEGPQVSYVYDRAQGFELSRPEGLRLSLEDEGNQVRQSAFSAEEMREKAEAFTRRFGENIFQHPANGQAQQVAAIAYELADYAAEQAPLTYTNAEAAIAENFIRQLATGAKTIDLTQEYATDNQTAARERHEKALENLQVLIAETAQLPGYKVAAGHAIAEGLGEREVLAISHRQSQSMVA